MLQRIECRRCLKKYTECQIVKKLSQSNVSSTADLYKRLHMTAYSQFLHVLRRHSSDFEGAFVRPLFAIWQAKTYFETSVWVALSFSVIISLFISSTISGTSSRSRKDDWILPWWLKVLAFFSLEVDLNSRLVCAFLLRHVFSISSVVRLAFKGSGNSSVGPFCFGQWRAQIYEFLVILSVVKFFLEQALTHFFHR